VTFSDKIPIVKQTRLTAAQTCLLSLQRAFKIRKKVSEQKFVNIWHTFLEKSGKVHGYWYVPPPLGTTALFDGSKHSDRTNYTNLRDKVYWSKTELYLDKQEGGYLFSSPYFFHEDVPLIGDFGFTFYSGENQRIKDHFHRCTEIIKQLTEKISKGISFKELSALSTDIMQTGGFRNHIVSTTDKIKTNFGHTIPFLDRDPDERERKKIATGEPEIIYSVISKAREFINKESEYIISQNCAFTFEPRFVSVADPKLPTFSLHLIILFENSRKEILANFNGLFNFLDMDFLTKL